MGPLPPPSSQVYHSLLNLILRHRERKSYMFCGVLLVIRLLIVNVHLCQICVCKSSVFTHSRSFVHPSPPKPTKTQICTRDMLPKYKQKINRKGLIDSSANTLQYGVTIELNTSCMLSGRVIIMYS